MSSVGWVGVLVLVQAHRRSTTGTSTVPAAGVVNLIDIRLRQEAEPRLATLVMEQLGRSWAIRRVSPDFPGWAQALRRIEDIRSRQSFKPWLRQEYGVDLTSSGRIREILELMKSVHLPSAAELHHRISEYLAGRI